MTSLTRSNNMPQHRAPATPAEVAAARAYCAAERLANGLDPNPDAPPILVGPAAVLHFEVVRRPIGPRTLPMEQQLDLNESVDALVEEYGLAQVIRTVKLLAEMNGCSL
jgi:hypothetical protein